MAKEIEHKYLVVNDSYKKMAQISHLIRQGYLSKTPERTVRIRTLDDQGFITVKGKNQGDARLEYEYSIPYQDAITLLELCLPGKIEKRRYMVPFGGYIWEVDEFMGRLAGLTLAEIELPSSDAIYSTPDFIGENVTGNADYYNSNL